MKRITKLCSLFVVLAFCCMLHPQVAQADISGFFEYYIYDNQAVIQKYNGGEASVRIPATLGGKKVTRIYEFAFYNNDFIESVYIPDGVTSIGSEVFRSCDNLQSITGCKGVNLICGGAFADCVKLKSYPFTSNLKNIEYRAFLSTAISDVVFSANIEEIGEEAFRNCDNIKEIVIPDGIRLGGAAFAGCDGLKKAVLGNVSELRYNVFEKCSNLETVEIADGIKEITGSFFSSCTSLKTVNIPKTVRLIDANAFYGCTSLTSIEIPFGVLRIEYEAFANSGLKSLVLPNSLLHIDDAALYNTKLDMLQVPNSLTKFSCFSFSVDKIRCFKDSIGEEYANKNNIPIEYMKEIPTTKLTFDKQTIYVNAEDFVALNLKKDPTNTTDAMVWQSTSENIATVNGIGELTAHRAGSCTIVVTASSGASARINVVVSNAPSNISFAKKSVTLLKGATFTQKAVVSDIVGVRNDVIPEYSSSNRSVATVDKNGKVTAVGVGKAIITAKTGKLSAQYEVVVNNSNSSNNGNNINNNTNNTNNTNSNSQIKLTKAKIKSVTSKKKKVLKVTWNSVKNATGYEVQYGTSSKFKGAKTKKVKASAKQVTIKKLKSRKKYYVRVRAVRDVNGKKTYGAWSKKKNVKVK